MSCFPEYAGALIPIMYPDLSPMSWSLSETDGCLTLSQWDIPSSAPTPEQVVAYHDSPAYLAHVRAQRAAQLAIARQTALTARMGETWPGMSAGEVAISIAAQEPTAAVVAAYLADRQAILAAHESAVAALSAMTLEQLEAAIAAGAQS